MSCNLNKFKSYDAGQIHHDNGTGVYNVSLINPGATCPDGAFNGKKVEVVVKESAAPSLTYNVADNKPVITVPSKGYIIEYGSSFGFFDFVWLLIVVGIVAFIGRKIYVNYLNVRKKIEESQAACIGQENTLAAGCSGRYSGYPHGSVKSAPAGWNNSTQNAPAGGTTIINNGSNSSGLLTGVLLGEMLGGHNSGGDVVNNTTNNYSSETSDNYSSDAPNNDTFSSDSSSDDSYSSDSSSDDSYSSDSSSDDSFSSDSGSDSYSSDGD